MAGSGRIVVALTTSGVVRPTRKELQQRINRFTARQHGVIGRAQALDAGLSVRQIEWLLRQGRWRVTGVRGVYRIAGHRVTWQQKAMAACLGAPEGTLASHLTAAALFGLHRHPEEPHVTVSGGPGRRAGMIVHRGPLPVADRCEKDGVPATMPARTLVDCGAVLPAAQLMGVVDAALTRALTTPAKVLAVVDRLSPHGRRRGMVALAEILAVWTEGIRPGSPAEMRLLRRLQRWGVPAPVPQYEIRDGKGLFVARADLAWPDHTAGLEYDGQEHHGPRQWEHDEERQHKVEELGWRLERVEKVDLLNGAERLREVVGSLLSGPGGPAR